MCDTCSRTTRRYHPDFTVSPTSGIIPAQGSTEVAIQFTPVKLTTARMVVLVRISQFGFEPFRCEILGSAAAGMTREAAMAALRQEVLTTSAEEPALTTAVNMYTTTVKVPTHGIGSGAVFDPGYTAVERRAKRRAGATKRSRGGRTARLAALTGGQSPSATSRSARSTRSGQDETPETPDVGGDSMIDGVRVPQHINGVPASNFILTQQPGKMKPKDLAAAIEQQNKQRAKQKAAQERLRATMGVTAGAGEAGPGLTLQAMVAEESGAGLDDADEDALSPRAPDTDEAPVRMTRDEGGVEVASAIPARLNTGVVTGVTFDDVEEDVILDMDVDNEAVDDKAKPVRGSAEDPRRLKEMVFLQDVGEIDKVP